MGSGVAGHGVTVPYINTIQRRPHTSLGFASTDGRPSHTKEFKEITKRFTQAPERLNWNFQYYDVSDDEKEQTMHQMFMRTVEAVSYTHLTLPTKA